MSFQDHGRDLKVEQQSWAWCCREKRFHHRKKNFRRPCNDYPQLIKRCDWLYILRLPGYRFCHIHQTCRRRRMAKYGFYDEILKKRVRCSGRCVGRKAVQFSLKNMFRWNPSADDRFFMLNLYAIKLISLKAMHRLKEMDDWWQVTDFKFFRSSWRKVLATASKVGFDPATIRPRSYSRAERTSALLIRILKNY